MEVVRLESLRYLQEIAKTKSINKAAESLFISKSALSTAIKNLENEFGVPLLERSVHGVTLTEAGENVVERANLIFNIINGMKNDCLRYTDKGRELNVFMESDFASSIFPPILVGLKKTFPNTYISSQSLGFKEIFDKVREDINNIGIFIYYEDEVICKENIDSDMYGGVNYYKIDTFELAVVSSKYSKYIPLNVTELTAEELKDIPQVRLSGAWGNREEQFKNSKFSGIYEEGNYVLSTDNNTVYFQAILNDFGVGRMLKMPILFGNSDRKQLRFIPIEKGEKMSLWLICNKKMNKEYANEILRCIKQTVNAS